MHRKQEIACLAKYDHTSSHLWIQSASRLAVESNMHVTSEAYLEEFNIRSISSCLLDTDDEPGTTFDLV